MARGIDYGLGTTNIDRSTGIRFGVIPQNDVLQAWADSSEADYGDPACPECGGDIGSLPLGCNDEPCTDEYESAKYGCNDHACHHCARWFDSSEVYGDEPNGFTYNSDGYEACAGSDGDIFITKSPYYTRAGFCSPCAPGACYLRDACDDGEKAYCFGHDWFEGGRAPYPVYRVDNDEIVNPE